MSEHAEKAPLATGDDSSFSSIVDGLGTSSVDTSETVSAATHRNYVAKSYLQKNELVTEVQRLRIELRRKNDEVEQLHAQMIMAADESDDKVEDLRRENMRLRAELSRSENFGGMKMQDETIRRELTGLIERIKGLEMLNHRLSSEQAIAKQHFRLVRLSEAEYEELKVASMQNDLSLSEMVSLRVHEEMKDCISKLEKLSQDNAKYIAENREIRQQLSILQRQMEEKSDENDQLKWTNTRLEKRIANLLGGPGAIAAHEPQSLYETIPVQQRSDALENDIVRSLRTQMENVTAHLSTERERLVRELETAREALRVAVDEGTLLRRQAIDAGQRSVFLEERVTSLSAQLDALKAAREELLEKYLASKEEARTEFNERLIREIEEIRKKSAAEYERLNKQVKEVCEQECTSLRLARDVAVSERDRAVMGETESRNRYEKMLTEFKALEFSLESHTADLSSQLRVKTFELERVHGLLQETDANLRVTKEAYESLRLKFDSLIRDHQSISSEYAFERKKLEDELDSVRHKLDAFERTEADMDDLVMQAAGASPPGHEAERVLVAYGAVAAAPPSFRHRLEQSVRLARRVLELEKVNAALRVDCDKKVGEVSKLALEVQDLTNLLSLSRNADQKLVIEALKTRDEELRSRKVRLHELETQLEAVQHELTVISKEKDDMAKDLGTLLAHRDEIAQIRYQLQEGNRCGSPGLKVAKSKSRIQYGRIAHNISPPVLLH